mgnify:CR=1 FL=1
MASRAGSIMACMCMHVEGAGGVSVTLMHGRDESSECELHMSEHLW